MGLYRFGGAVLFPFFFAASTATGCLQLSSEPRDRGYRGSARPENNLIRRDLCCLHFGLRAFETLLISAQARIAARLRETQSPTYISFGAHRSYRQRAERCLRSRGPMVPAPPHLDFEAWKDRIRQIGGRFDPQDIDPEAFAGWVRPITAYGLTAAEVGSNAHVVERACSGMFASLAQTTMLCSFNLRAVQQ